MKKLYAKVAVAYLIMIISTRGVVYSESADLMFGLYAVLLVSSMLFLLRAIVKINDENTLK